MNFPTYQLDSEDCACICFPILIILESSTSWNYCARDYFFTFVSGSKIIAFDVIMAPTDFFPATHQQSLDSPTRDPHASACLLLRHPFKVAKS